MFIGAIFFRFFGVLIRWLLMNVNNILIKKKPSVGFLKVWRLGEEDDFLSNASVELTDIIIGYIFIMALCVLLVFF